MNVDEPALDRDLPADRAPARGDAAHGHPLELALRHGLRFSSLRDAEIDPRLLLYVPLELCEREMVLPLRFVDDVLEIATAVIDPELELVRSHFPELEIELVFASAERIDDLRGELKAAL